MGVVGAVAAVCLWSMADSRRQRHYVAAGYLVAVPVAFFGALVGGLVLPSFLGPLVFGGVPLVAGSCAGFVMGPTQSAAPAWRSR